MSDPNVVPAAAVQSVVFTTDVVRVKDWFRAVPTRFVNRDGGGNPEFPELWADVDSYTEAYTNGMKMLAFAPRSISGFRVEKWTARVDEEVEE